MNKTEFLEYVKAFCKSHGIEFKTFEGHVAYTVVANIEVNGFFEHNKNISPTLGIALNMPEEQMFYEVLAHEFCHAQQYLENSPYWTGSRLTDEEVATYSKVLGKDITGWETGDLFQAWLDKELEICPVVLDNIVERTTAVEFDCESRTIALAQKMGLEISPKEYAQKANAYLLTYYFALKTRTWTTPGYGPAYNQSVYTQMPTEINQEYCKNISPELIDLIKTYCIVKED